MTVVRSLARRTRQRLVACLTGVLIGAMASTGAVGIAPAGTPAHAAPAPVEGGELEWGFLGSWRSYVTGFIAQGEINALAPATQSGDVIEYVNGSGSVDVDAGSGTVSYEGTMESLGHLDDGVWGLNQTLTDPEIELTSTTTATLSFEVTQDAYSGFPARSGEREVIANLTFDAAELGDREVTAAATMSAAGAVVYGPANDSYKEGAPLDPVTFTLPAAGAVDTTTVLSGPTETVKGDALELTARVEPAAADGSVVFSRVAAEGSAELATVQVADGVASASIPTDRFPVGSLEFGAAFVPDDPARFRESIAESIVVDLQPHPDGTALVLGELEAEYDTGAAVPLRFTVDPEDAAGTIELRDADDTVLAEAAHPAGATTILETPALSRGENRWTASFIAAPESGLLDADPIPVTLTAYSETSLALTAAPASLVQGETLALTARVTPADAAGTVQFLVDGKPLDSPQPVADGAAVLRTTDLAVGTRTLSAQLLPADDSYFRGSASPSQTVKVTSPDGAEVEVEYGYLTWTLKSNWIDYVVGPIADGEVLAASPATVTSNVVTWANTGQAETVNLGTGSGSIRYRGAMIARGHAGLGPGGTDGLNQRLSDPIIRLTSPTSAVLSAVVSQPHYGSFPKIDRQRIDMVTLSFRASDLRKGVVTGASATLTQSGARVFGNFPPNYVAGVPFGTVSFTVNEGPVRGTQTSLTADPRVIEQGNDVRLTAQVAPKDVAGTIVFADGNRKLGTRTVSGGTASITVRDLPVGDRSLTATFTPKGAGISGSVGTFTLKVNARKNIPPATSGTGSQAGALVWGVSTPMADYTTGPIAKGAVQTTGVGGGRGGYVFPQASGGSWNRATHTGTVPYTGTVRYVGHNGLLNVGVSNPTITVASATSGTISSGGSAFGSLDLAAATKSVGSDGSVTWSNVPVAGGFTGGASGSNTYTLPADPLTFTVGSPSKAAFGSTEENDEPEQRTPADTPPTTTGITVLTNPDRIVAGGRIVIEASGFDPGDEGVLVVLYSDPILLDDAARADENGVVQWSGTLPDDVIGEHVITLQGSTDAGAVIDILDPQDRRSAAVADAAERGVRISDAEAISAGPAAPGGMALWEWWASAGGLVLIAACMTALVVRQRRLNP